MKKRKNFAVRVHLLRRGVFMYELAEQINTSANLLSRKLGKELTASDVDYLIEAIDLVAQRGGVNSD